jgi:PmbA protein
MDIEIFIQKLTQKAKESNLSQYEIYYSKAKTFSTRIFNGEIDDYKNTSSLGLSFRAIHNNQMGYSYTENFDEDSILFLINGVIENCNSLEREDVESLFEGALEYTSLKTYNGSIEKVPVEDKIDFAKKLEKEAKSLDPRVHSVNYCLYGDGVGERIIVNSNGLKLREKEDSGYCYLSVVVKDSDDIKTGSAFQISNSFDEFDYKKVAKEAVDEAVSLLGAKSLESGSYDIVIRNRGFASLLGAMSGIFSAEAVEKGVSKLENKLNTKIAASNITLTDNPHLLKGGSTRAFDDEGVPTKPIKIVENGLLKTYFHNLKTSKKAGIPSTGHGQKGSYKGDINIAPFNFYLEPGSKSLEELTEKLGTGLLLIEFGGIHSGLNSISGDFSLITSGYYIENGKIVKPVNQITFAGNFFDILNNIEELGNDLKFNLPSVETVGSPSLLIRNMKISGE